VSETKRRARKVEPIPEFASREEEAKFWDTHDLTDYWDQWTPSKVRFKLKPLESITIDLDAHNMKLLRAAAKKQGIAIEPLIQIWILEHLQAQD